LHAFVRCVRLVRTFCGFSLPFQLLLRGTRRSFAILSATTEECLRAQNRLPSSHGLTHSLPSLCLPTLLPPTLLYPDTFLTTLIACQHIAYGMLPAYAKAPGYHLFRAYLPAFIRLISPASPAAIVRPSPLRSSPIPVRHLPPYLRRRSGGRTLKQCRRKRRHRARNSAPLAHLLS